MFSSLIFLTLVFITFDAIDASGSSEQEVLIDFTQIGSLDQCEGKDASNYTVIMKWKDDQTCGAQSSQSDPAGDLLVSSMPNRKKVVNALKALAVSCYPAGAYYQCETLYIVTGGNLEGKYLYLKDIGLNDAYNKKCSSVLGYSYETSETYVLLIAEELDLNVVLSPNGGYEAFKRSAHTVCKGKANNF